MKRGATLTPTERQTSTKHRGNRDWDRMLKITWTVIGWIVLGLAGLWLLGRLWTVLLPLLLGLLIVFFLRPPVEWLVGKGAPRVAAVGLCYLVALALLVGAGVLLAPSVARQAEQFTTALPTYIEQAQVSFRDSQDRYDELLPDWAVIAVDEALDSAVDELGNITSGIAGRILTAGRSIFGLATGLITGLAVGFYLLYSLPRVGPGILDAMPPGWRRDARDASERVEETVGGFVRGQVIVAAIVGVLTWLGMTVIGMPFPGFIGVLAGVLDIVPYVGPVVAAIVAIIIGLFTEPILALWALLVIIAIQQLETHIIGPKVMGSQVGLHPVIVILAIIAGTTLFGFIGLLLAVPTVGTIKALYGFYAEKHGWEPW